jgi:glycosyltransferase involved in cell wall biosynthesis
MQRILFLSSVYPRSYDPTRGTYCYATCKALAEQGHDMRVVSPRSWLECLRHRSPGNECFEREVGPTEFPSYFYPPGILQSTYGWWMWNSIRRPLLRIANDFQPEAILSQWADPDGTTAVRLGRLFGVPVGIIVGGSDVLLLTKDARRRKVITRTLQATDAVFAVSRDLQEKTIALGVDPAKVHVTYRGVDESFCPGSKSVARERLGLRQDREILLWVGRMAPVKGLEVLLAAMERIAKQRPQAMLVLVGDGPIRTQLERDIERRGLGQHVKFIGAVVPEDLPDWYRAADLTVLSSHSEGIPNVLRESLACGTPYVSTAVGGIAELSDHPAIRLVPPRDPAAFARGVFESLASPQSIPANLIERGWSRRSQQIVDCLAGSRTVARENTNVTLEPVTS